MQGFQYHVDLVFCIDATGSMAPVMEEVKSNALRLHSEIMSALGEKDKFVDVMRIKVIAFRDVYDDSSNAFEISDFMELPKQAKDFEAFVRALKTEGGGDEPENGLEALAMALKSDWTKSGTKRRHVIAFWTDASAHPLEKAATAKPAGYPGDMPGSFNELTDLWEGQGVDVAAKRLLLFAPDASPWSQVQDWENTAWFASRAGSGLDELSYKEILNAVVNSVS